MAQRNESLRSQARKIVYNVHSFMAKEAKDGVQNLKQVQKRTAEATQTSLSSVRRIVQEAKLSTTTSTLRNPTKGRDALKRITGLDHVHKVLIKKTIHRFHLNDTGVMTINKLLEKLRKEIGFQGSERSLRRIIKDLGFRWRKAEGQKKILIEKSSIRLKRIEYLRTLQKYQRQRRPIIYTDISYIHSSHNSSKNENDNLVQGLKKMVVKKGELLVVLNAGSENGFVPKSLLTYSQLTHSDDLTDVVYHNWLKTKLIPNLPPESVVVVDNSSYHIKETESAITSTSNKADMQAWLIEKGILFTSDMLKPQLFNLIKLNKIYHTQFSIDKILTESGHDVLRLPPCHAELNPAKVVWLAIKEHVFNEKDKWTEKKIIDIIKEKVDAMGSNDWKKLCDKSKEIEDLYVENDHIIDDLTDEVTIQPEDSSDSDADKSSSDEEDPEVVCVANNMGGFTIPSRNRIQCDAQLKDFIIFDDDLPEGSTALKTKSD